METESMPSAKTEADETNASLKADEDNSNSDMNDAPVDDSKEDIVNKLHDVIENGIPKPFSVKVTENQPVDIKSEPSETADKSLKTNGDSSHSHMDDAPVADFKGESLKKPQNVIENGVSNEESKDSESGSENDEAMECKSNTNGNPEDSGHYDNVSDEDCKKEDGDSSEEKSHRDSDVAEDDIERKLLNNCDLREVNDSSSSSEKVSETVDKIEDKCDSEKENANSDDNTNSDSNEVKIQKDSDTSSASSVVSEDKQADSMSNDDIQIIGESKVVKITSPSVPNSSQKVIIIPQMSSKHSTFPSSKPLQASHMPIISSSAYSPGLPNFNPGFLLGGNANLSPALSMLPQPVAPPKPKSSLDQIELIRWEIQNRINTRPKYFKPNPTAELGPLSKFLFDIGSDLIKESVYHELVKIQSKKHEDNKLSDKEKEDLDKLKDIEKDLNSTVGHLKFRMRKRCRTCYFQTESSNIMYHHKQFPHEDNKNLLCAHCNFATKQAMNYKFHIESEHGIQPRLHDKKFFYECDLCPYENNQEQKLTIHKQRCSKQFRPLFNLHPSCLSGAEINLCLENIFYKPLIPKNLKILQQKHLQQQAALAAAKKQQAEVAALAAQKNAQAALAKRQRPPPPAPTSSRQRFSSPPISNRPQFQARLPQPMTQVRFNSRTPIQPIRPTVASMLKDKHTPKSGSGFPQGHQGGAPVGFEVCEICGGYVKDRKALRIHFFYAHRIDLPLNLFERSQPPLYCATCCVRFWTANGLRKHLDVHAQEKRLPEGFIGEGVSGKCIACGQLVGNIVVHMRVVHNREIHHYINALMCMFCGASFNSHANVERHIKDVHGTIDIATGAVKMKGKLKSAPPMPKAANPQRKPGPSPGGNSSLVKGSVCVLCNLNFGRNVDLTRHCMRMHHTCMKCGMVVIDKASLLKHTCLSSPSGTRDCIMCAETGFHPAYYVKHLRDKHLRKFSINVARLSVPVIERWTKRAYPFKQVREELVEISDSDDEDGPVAKFKVEPPTQSPRKRPRIGPASKINRSCLSNGDTNASETRDNDKNSEINEDDDKEIRSPSRRDSSSHDSPIGSKRKHSFDSVTPERHSKRRK